MIESSPLRHVPSMLAGVMGLLLIALLRTDGTLILHEWWPALLWACPGLMLGARMLRSQESGSTVANRVTPGWLMLGALVLYIFSSGTFDSHAFLQPSIPMYGGKAISLAYIPAQLALSFSVLVITFHWKRFTPAMLMGVLLWSGILLLGHAFLNATGGDVLYRDDHPAFMHRFWGIKEAFPAWAFYDPTWNGGRMQNAVAASGAANLGFLFQPLWQIGPIHEVYNLVFFTCFMLGLPAVAIASARLCGCQWTGTLAAGCLALTLSRYFWLWLLNYGTVSACATSPMILLIAAIFYRVIYLKRCDRWLLPLFAFSMFFYLAWPPSAIMGIPIAIAVACSLCGADRKEIHFVLLLSAVGVCAAIPGYLAILANVDLGRMAGIHSDHPEIFPAVEKGFNILLSHFQQGHPLILFLGLVGVWFLRIQGSVRFFGVALLGLMLLAGWGESWKPQYQLVRSGIPLICLAILPAALWIDRLTSHPRAGRIAAALIGALLIVGGFTARDVYANKTPIRFKVMSPHMHQLVDYLKEHSQPDDRILFAGSTVHGVGGGHVAYLPVLTEREMLSCDYYAFSPKLVEYNYPPRAWRKEKGGVERFLNLYNVSHVITYHDHWIQYFKQRPEIYQFEYSFGEKLMKQVYRVKGDSTLFLKGAGRIEAGVNELQIITDAPAEELVIKYNWVDDLRIESPAVMRPYDAGHGVKLIAIEPNGLQNIRIFHKGLW